MKVNFRVFPGRMRTGVDHHAAPSITSELRLARQHFRGPPFQSRPASLVRYGGHCVVLGTSYGKIRGTACQYGGNKITILVPTRLTAYSVIETKGGGPYKTAP